MAYTPSPCSPAVLSDSDHPGGLAVTGHEAEGGEPPPGEGPEGDRRVEGPHRQVTRCAHVQQVVVCQPHPPHALRRHHQAENQRLKHT